jgi:hypothetical protein
MEQRINGIRRPPGIGGSQGPFLGRGICYARVWGSMNRWPGIDDSATPGIDGPLQRGELARDRRAFAFDRFLLGRQCIEHRTGDELIAGIIEMNPVQCQDARFFIPGIILQFVVMKELPQIN